MTLKSLPDLFETTALPEGASSEWERAALACSRNREAAFNSSTALAVSPTGTPSDNFETYLDHWRDLLVANLLANPRGDGEKVDAVIQERMRKLLQVPLWRDSQLATALVSLNAHFCQQHVSLVTPHTKPTGFALERREQVWTGGSVPTPRVQAELAFMWACLGHLTGEASLVNAARRIAGWLLSCFDVDYCPPSSLLEREDQWHEAESLTNLYLLFHALAILQQDTRLEYVAQRQLQKLEALVSAGKWRVPPYAVVLTAWIESLNRVPQAYRLPLSPLVCDQGASLVGYRTDVMTWFGTLIGANTGLGYLRFRDVEVTNYGPQITPLNHMDNFGFIKEVSEASMASNEIMVDEAAGTLTVKGRTRLASYGRTLPGVLSQTRRSPLWMDVEQRFGQGMLELRTRFFSLVPIEQVAFCFFVRGASCVLPESDQRIQRGSLNGVRAFSETVVVEGGEGSIEISPREPGGRLEVHALEGSARYWGAHFLIAYLCDPAKTSSGWVMRSSEA